MLASAQAKKKAVALAARIKKERGVSNGVAAFYKHLPADFLDEKRKQHLSQPELSSPVSTPFFHLPSHCSTPERSPMLETPTAVPPGVKHTSGMQKV